MTRWRAELRNRLRRHGSDMHSSGADRRLTQSAGQITPVESAAHLSVRGARVHNLKNVDLEIPRDSLVVFTGLSGSGKSSLAFDTIFAEGQRRYVESLSAYARQFLGQVDRPDVDFIEGLSPAVSIDQKSTNRNPRSTVGTITEIYDYMRLLWARIGDAALPGVRRADPAPDRAADRRPAHGARDRHPLPGRSPRSISQKKGEFVDLFKELAASGYSRARRRRRGSSSSASRRSSRSRYKHDISVVVDRLVAADDLLTRLTDSLETALGLTDGLVDDQLRRRGGRRARWRTFSEKLSLPQRPPAPAHRDRAAHLLVQRAVRRLPRVLGPRHQDGGRRRPAHRRPEPHAQRGRHPALEPGGQGAVQLLPAAARGPRARPRLLARHPVGRAAGRASQQAILRGNDFEVRVQVAQPLRPRR